MHQRHSRSAESFSVAILVCAAIVFGGWIFNVDLMKSFVPGAIGMKLVTATAFMLLGFALLIEARKDSRTLWISTPLAALVLLFATVSLMEYAFGRAFFVDVLWHAETPGAIETLQPGRMAPLTALAFIAAAVATMLLRRRDRAANMIAQTLTAVVAFVSLFVLVGYLYGAHGLRGPSNANPMAFSSALVFAFCACALGSLRSEEWPLSVLAGRSENAFIARVLFGCAIGIPVAAGWFRVQIERLGYLSTGAGSAAIAIFNAIILTMIVVGSLSRSSKLQTAPIDHSKGVEGTSVEGWTVSRKGLLIIAVPALFQIVFVTSLFIIERTENSERANAVRAQAIIASTYRLLGLLVDAETGVRGYGLTGRPEFNEPYDHAVLVFPSELAHLKTLTDESQDADVDRLRSLAAPVLQHYGEMKRRLGAREDITNEWRQGKIAMDSYRDATSRFLIEEERERGEQDHASQVARDKIVAALVVGCIVTLALAAYMSVYFTRSITQRVRVVLTDVARVERGELPESRDLGTDEIGELHRRFEQMAQVLDRGRRELQLANEGLESFSYSVSHDLRAPLRAVDGYTRIIEEDYAAVLDEEGRRLLGVVRGEARRMGALIDDLLTFSRLGRQRLSLSVVDVHALLDELMPSIRALRPDRRIELIDQALPMAIADRGTIRQVMINLLSNAVKYAKEEGRICIEVGGRSAGRESLYWVRDSGVGFDMKYVGKLFGVFQRLHHDQKFEGTGVGLAIVQRIIVAHGGRVWAEGQLDHGATFYFTLPAAATPQEQETPVEEEQRA